MKNTAPYSLVCVSCGKSFSEQETVGSCLSCNSGLDVVYAHPRLPVSVDWSDEPFEFLKKNSLLPTTTQLITLGEGNTPLVHSKAVGKKYGLTNLFLKCEGANPTGVFKDRGSAVEITKAIELGAKAVTCASTGNMAASVAAYCAKAKIPCYVVIPEKTPMGKLAQAIAYGARVLKVRGDYRDCVRLSVEMAKHYGFYLAGDYAFRGEGQKSVAYELMKQCNGVVPDWVIVPVGCGTNLSAIYKGFTELVQLGLIKKLPRFIGVQPDTVPTIVEAWRQKKNNFVPVEAISTIASAVGIGCPLDDKKVLTALYNSKGYAESASEEAIITAQQLLGNAESLFVEPSAALPVAVLSKLLENNVIKKDDVIVAVLTGNGLKDPQSILSADVQSPVLEPTLAELERYFSIGAGKSKKVSLAEDKEKTLWKKMPTHMQLKAELKKLFGVTLSASSLENAYEIIKSFHEKEKIIRKGDIEYALETILKTPEGMKRTLIIENFSVHATQHHPAEAWVLLNFKGQQIGSHAKGVGPVDAIIGAIHRALEGKDTTGAHLTFYNVQINTSGTDAVVEVRLSLKSASGLEVTGEAASPDVIVASIKAFESAYNILNYKLYI